MKVAVLYQQSGEDATVEDRDVLVQRDAVAAALQQLGHQTTCFSCTLDLATTRQQLLSANPDVVFNLVESLGGTDRLIALATMLLDALQIPYTGAQTAALLATSNKLTAKQRFSQAGLPTPAWFAVGQRCEPCFSPLSLAAQRHAGKTGKDANEDQRWILKPVLEHASFGMDDHAVVTANELATLESMLNDRQELIGRPLFAERFIDGREFNLSLLKGQVLPPAEIDFSTFPLGKPRIVGHQAKWDEDSMEYQQTPRCFEFPAADRPLLRRVSQLAQDCWQLFDLSGYARVDFRVDREGRPWILEVNANPCLSPDAGFAAALSQAGLTYCDAIEQIIQCALRRFSKPLDTSPALSSRT